MSTVTNRPPPVLSPGSEVFDAEGPVVSMNLTTAGSLPDAAYPDTSGAPMNESCTTATDTHGGGFYARRR